MQSLRMWFRVWWMKHFGASSTQWQWGHPDEWTDEEWYDFRRNN